MLVGFAQPVPPGYGYRPVREAGAQPALHFRGGRIFMKFHSMMSA